VSGSGISWAVCKSAPCCRQITMPYKYPYHTNNFIITLSIHSVLIYSTAVPNVMEISFTVVQYNTPTPTPQFFTGWMPFLPPNQQRQSTEGIACVVSKIKKCVSRPTRDVAPAPHSIVGSWEECSVHFLSAALTASSLHRVSHSNLCLFIHGLSAL